MMNLNKIGYKPIDTSTGNIRFQPDTSQNILDKPGNLAIKENEVLKK